METFLVAAPIIASPWSRPLDRERERAIKRDAVLRAAAQLFNEFGYHATSLAMVAQRLQVTKPTLYYYVQNKEEILFECVRLGLELLRSAIAAAAASGLEYKADDGQIYHLNLIDTPGHVDFSYEVSRSLSACEGALLVVDASQGVEAQSVANCYTALDLGVEVTAVLIKSTYPLQTLTV